MKSETTSQRSRRVNTTGFSLVEMLTAVAVLGVMTAIAITVYSNVMAGVEERRIARIAQEFASTATNAVAAGADDFVNVASVAEVIDKLVSGVRGSGVFQDTEFKVTNTASIDRIRVARHLVFSDGILIYNSGV